MVGFIRFATLAAFGVFYLGLKIRRKNDQKNNLKESDLSQYKKNEEGLYPWEVYQDDSPKRIEPNASRYVNQARPRRGRW
ncbi:hypothetical protein FP317_002141 [Enterococcus faecium]|nr:hypothetical protein [Enterococcus faecium]